MARPQPRGGDPTAVRKGTWTAPEDAVLLQHVREHGPLDWSSIRSKGLLPRSGKSCRLRWVNKLRPGLKTGCKFSPEEECVVLDLQAQFGNKWAKIAKYLPGRTDNDVKNFWSMRQKRLGKILRMPLPPRMSPKPNISTPASHELHLPISKEPTTHHIGQSSRIPRLPDPESTLPSAIEFTMDGGECSSSRNAAAHMPFYVDAGGNTAVPTVDLALFTGDGDAYPGMQAARLFGLEQDDYGHVRRGMNDVRFDDLTPETFNFFELSSSPPSPPPPPPPSPASQM